MMKRLAVAFLLGAAFLGGCATSDASWGKIGPDYSGNQAIQAGRVHEMHSGIQRGTY